jgi:thiopurine S-methyltransferase
MTISHRAMQLLICFDYRQSEIQGPPFAITDAEVQQHFGQTFHLQLIANCKVEGGLKGLVEACEKVWLLAL